MLIQMKNSTSDENFQDTVSESNLMERTPVSNVDIIFLNASACF